jgi:hypothetical protein
VEEGVHTLGRQRLRFVRQVHPLDGAVRDVVHGVTIQLEQRRLGTIASRYPSALTCSEANLFFASLSKFEPYGLLLAVQISRRHHLYFTKMSSDAGLLLRSGV